MAQQKKQDGSLYTVTKEDYYQKLNLLMIIRDSIAVGLRKYQDVWKKYFYHQSTLTLAEI